jgi:hypothetical protein
LVLNERIRLSAIGADFPNILLEGVPDYKALVYLEKIPKKS